MKNRVIQLIKTQYILFGLLFLFLLLLFRNPYSSRTLIPNLEPFPDSMYYTTPPRCFILGYDWKMCRLSNPELPGIAQVVPPAYSISLIPAYLLNFDVRSFYFVNILLSFLSLLLLYKISNIFFKNKFISGFICFVYITTYSVYWYPTLAMSENLMQPLFLFSIYVLQLKAKSLKISFFAGLLAALFYATKYAYAPLTVSYPILFVIKLWFETKNKTEFTKNIVSAAIPGGVILFGLTNFAKLFEVLNLITNGALNSNSSDKITSGGGDFSYLHFIGHAKEYLSSLLGESQRFLWDRTPLLEKWIAVPANFGLLVSLKTKEYLFAKAWLIVAIISQILFMSNFYFSDTRYIYHLLPALLLGFGFFLSHLEKTIFINKLNFYSFLFTIFMVYFVTNAIRIKTTIMVNLKYSETPWWYLSQLEVDKYFESNKKSNSRPYLVTLYAPFLTDNYTKQNFNPLPLDKQQDFKGSFEKIWGKGDYTNLIKLYAEKLEKGHEVYVTNYGVNAAGHFEDSYKEIFNNFKTTEVYTGCYNLCNIYKLSIKETNE